MRYAIKNSSRRSPKAVILLAVLVVVVLLTLAAYQYSELVTAEYRAADSYARSGQAKAFAASGVHYVAAIVGNSTNFTSQLNGNPYDNSTAFQGIIVAPSDDPRHQGRFSIVSPHGPDDTTTGGNPFHYGLTDESGKININALMKIPGGDVKAHAVLMNLPNMTEEIANSILDWIDSDDTPRSTGAENDYYSTLNPPYRCKNGPLSTPEELLLVKGVTPPLFLGNDFNRNGILDPGEDDGTGVSNQGWSAYLTCYSRELNFASDGTTHKININDSNNLTTLNTDLQTALESEELANYIIMGRLYKVTPGAGGSTSLSVTDRARALQKMKADLQNPQQQKNSIGKLFDLVDSHVSITVTVGTPPRPQIIQYPSPLTLKDPGTLRQLLPILLDKTTTTDDSNTPAARINVNTAPRAVLSALLPTFSGLTDTDVQTIIDHRPSSTSPDAADDIFKTPAWLITEANFSPATMSALEQYITASSLVYRIQSIGYFDGGGPTARIEAVIDANNQRPRIVSWRDLTELGKGFNINPR